jgi:hypothetical protein
MAVMVLVLNEEVASPTFVRALHGALDQPGIRHAALFEHDGSTDTTPAGLRAAAQADPRIGAIHLCHAASARTLRSRRGSPRPMVMP